MKKIIYNNNCDPSKIINDSFLNYEKALNARTLLLHENNGEYISHGGKNILHGHGTIAYEILKDIPKNKSISFYVTVGAGGTIGIGHCMKLLRNNITFNIVQTTEFSSFIQSIQQNKMIKNNLNQDISISEGIAVDQPEITAFELAKECVDNFITVDTDKALSLISETGLGNSTCITLSGIQKNDKSDVIIVLDCEGN